MNENSDTNPFSDDKADPTIAGQEVLLDFSRLLGQLLARKWLRDQATLGNSAVSKPKRRESQDQSCKPLA